MSKLKNKPAIRFNGFSDSWEQRQIGEVTTKIGSGKTPKGGKDVYLKAGIPLLRSQNIVNEEVNLSDVVFISESIDAEMSNSRVYKNDVLLNITGASIGRSAVYRLSDPANVNQHVCILRPELGVNADFIQLNLTSPNGQKQVDSNQAGSGREGLNFQQIAKLIFFFPALYEQNAISNIFRSLDNLITLEQREYSKTVNIKKAMLEKMFPREGADRPVIRFAGYTGAWERQKLNEVTSRITRKNQNLESTLPLTISSLHGLVDQITYFNYRVASRDVSNYYLVKKGEFAYNKSYSDGFPFGSVKRLDRYEMGVLSTLYIVFALNFEIVDSDYLVSYYETSNWHKQVSERAAEGARNHGLLNITATDFFDTEIEFPKELTEQRQIGTFFKNFDNLISLHQIEIKKLQNIKKAMLEKMLM